MNSKYRNVKKYALLLGMLLFFPLMLMLTARFMKHTFKTLPYYQLSEGIPTAVFSEEGGRTVQFDSLLTHEGTLTNSAAFGGKVYLAFFFSPRSPHLVKITKRLLYATYKYPDEEDIVFVCFNTEPEATGTVEMNTFMQDAKARKGKWFFLTGEPQRLDRLYKEGFLMSDYREVSRIWLVDTKGALRGHYNANKEQEIERAIEDIALLKRELRVEEK